MTAAPSRSVLVIGATGTQGGAVARRLLARDVHVRALTRDPAGSAARSLARAGAEVVRGDLDDPAALDAAVTGVDGVFSIQDVVTAGDDGEHRQGAAVVDAAVRAGVAHLVQASAGGVDRAPDLPGFVGKGRVEQHLTAAGVPWTVLAPTWFMSNWDWPVFRPAVLAGRLALPLDPTTRLQQIAPTDIGTAAADAFAHPDRWVGRRVELAGDELTAEGTARALGAALGRPVVYEQVPWEAWLSQNGPFLHGLFRWYQDHGYRADIPALRRELPGLATFADHLAVRGPSDRDAPPS